MLIENEQERTGRITKKELLYDGIKVVFDNPKGVIDNKRAFIINCILLYASVSGKTIKIIFFNGDIKEKGVSFFFCKDDEDVS